MNAVDKPASDLVSSTVVMKGPLSPLTIDTPMSNNTYPSTPGRTQTYTSAHWSNKESANHVNNHNPSMLHGKAIKNTECNRSICTGVS